MDKQFGSYSPEDVEFLLKNLNGRLEERSNEERERLIQGGGHYSEMLPIEYVPSAPYMDLYHQSLERTKDELATATAIVATALYRAKGPEMTLVSLARAGTPAGILIKRYLKAFFGIEVPHYSISIIRGKGIDQNALKTILSRHKDYSVQFIDGWTGKGAITLELKDAIEEYNQEYGAALSPELAVLADPGDCAACYGTKKDFLIPSSLLNSTVSGLVSRTVLRADLIAPDEYHGAKYYKHLKDVDLSNDFIDCITKCFRPLEAHQELENQEPRWLGMADVKKIGEAWNVDNIHFIKPGIGETTRVLLRRVPWKVVLDTEVSEEDVDVSHIVQLAKEKQVPIVRMSLQSYRCCGIIKSVKGDKE